MLVLTSGQTDNRSTARQIFIRRSNSESYVNIPMRKFIGDHLLKFMPDKAFACIRQFSFSAAARTSSGLCLIIRRCCFIAFKFLQCLLWCQKPGAGVFTDSRASSGSSSCKTAALNPASVPHLKTAPVAPYIAQFSNIARPVVVHQHGFAACNPWRNAEENGAASAARDTSKSFPPAAEYLPPAHAVVAVQA